MIAIEIFDIGPFQYPYYLSEITAALVWYEYIILAGVGCVSLHKIFPLK